MGKGSVVIPWAHSGNVALEGNLMLEKSVGIGPKAEMICRGLG